MNRPSYVVAIAALVWAHATLFAAETSQVPAYVTAEHRIVLEKWLGANKTLRVATDEDCKCKEDIAAMRRGYGGAWKANPDFHPYYVAGDFNGDGQADFAVVVIRNAANPKREVAIFNGPFSPDHPARPAYLNGKYAGALFFGPPRPKPWRLIVGPFESEGSLLVPKGSTYVFKPSNCC
jgi:hypothetical protein